MRALRLIALVCMLAVAGAAAAAELVVILSPKSGVEQLSRDEVVNIFLGRLRQLPTGVAAEPLDLPARSADKALFYSLLVNKDLAAINAYWARLVFSGQTSPPRALGDEEEVVRQVAERPGVIGYVRREAADKRVKVVHTLGQ